MLKVLSLGAGVQSTTVLLLSETGELPRLDCAIFADTKWEPPEVFLHRKCLPLEEVDLASPEDKGQMNWLNECSGHCGV